MLISEICFYGEHFFLILKHFEWPDFLQEHLLFLQTKCYILKGEDLHFYSRANTSYIFTSKICDEFQWENTLFKCRNEELMTYMKVVFLHLFKLMQLFQALRIWNSYHK